MEALDVQRNNADLYKPYLSHGISIANQSPEEVT
jgi:hypothetical protein